MVENEEVKVMKNIVTFDKELKEQILDIFDKTVDGQGLIVEKSNPKQLVLTQDGENLSIEEFAGITKGSEIFIKSDLISLIDFSKKK
ncbi:hypothetical protein J4458_03515 [Candidatus Woesearchaeota archaeon]|nr:hypothetical protein [Candidatus Woesearchaeota archaeon]